VGYRFPISSRLQREALPVSVHSVLGVAVVDARYELEGPERVQVEQGFFKGAPLMGLETDWPLTRDFSLGSEISSTVPIVRPPATIGSWTMSFPPMPRRNVTSLWSAAGSAGSVIECAPLIRTRRVSG